MRGTYHQIQLGTSSAEVWLDPNPHAMPLSDNPLDGWQPLLPPGMEWRDDQEPTAALVECLLADYPTVFVDAPTGIGKSVLALSAATGFNRDDEGLPPVILTSNLGLQQQYEGYGIRSITGRRNWPCLVDTTKTAEMAICTTGTSPADCHVYHACPYFVQKRQAIDSNMLVTNYSYALKAWGFSPNTPILIGDEAHSAEDTLRENATLKVYLYGAGHLRLLEHSEGVALAEDILTRMNTRFDIDDEPDEENAPLRSPKEKARIKARTLRRMMSTNAADWIVQLGDDELRFIPVRGFWPSVRSALYMSATIFNPYTTDPPGPVAYVRLPSPFPVENRRVYMGTRVSITHKSEDYEYQILADEIDHILNRHLGRGVIHTPSYHLADRISHLSAYRGDMITHRAGERDKAVEEFRNGERRILVSPAVSEGVDFPGRECEWQIIAKLPFPDSRDMVVKEIAARTEGLTETQVARMIVQQAGRGVRSKTDVCPTYILDAGFKKWFYPKNRELFPAWFKEALVPL